MVIGRNSLINTAQTAQAGGGGGTIKYFKL